MSRSPRLPYPGTWGPVCKKNRTDQLTAPGRLTKPPEQHTNIPLTRAVGGSLLEREYELFEQLADGAPIWRGHASGLHNVRAKLEEMARNTPNECFAIYLPTKEIVARLNVKARGAGGKKVVFQVAYDEKQSSERSEILRLCGYEVVSVIGNEAAKVILGMSQHCDLFIIGNGGDEDGRKALVKWLRAKYAGIPILALNSPGIRELAGADYNVEANGPRAWLRLVTGALGVT